MDRRPQPPQSALNDSATASEVIAPARLSWRDQQPYAEAYQDIYHSADGPQEVRRMFIEPSALTEKIHQRTEVLIGELGFGTALNFAVTAEICLKTDTRLHFVSFDAAPVGAAEFAGICAARAHDQEIYSELSELYPPLIRGWHRRYLAQGRITLSLFWGDATDGLEDIDGRQHRPFDAWFLDGFAPDRNPDMWTPGLLARIGGLSAAGSSVATFTAAGRVRRALEAAGFSMRRVDQQPHKRESLAGVHRGNVRRWWTSPTQVQVVGAGLAGASTARHLAERGINVQVFEAQATPAAGASGIPATVLHPRLLGDASTQAALRSHAYLYSSAYCGVHVDGPPMGALQLPAKNADPGRFEKIAARYASSGDWLALLEAEAASAKAQWEIHTSALWFPNSRVIDTPALCNALLDHPNIEPRYRSPLTSLTAHPTVLACGISCRDFSEANFLEIAPVYGQVDLVRLPNPPAIPLVGNGYLVPWQQHDLLAGTTYEYQPWDPAAATRANMAQLENIGLRSQWLSRARATRCVSSDRTPVAGRLYDMDRAPIANAYVSTAHGSMGTVFCHFAAALVTGQICGEFPPMTRSLEIALSSERFRLRQERRGVRHNAGQSVRRNLETEPGHDRT
ncbi:MAG: tRNA (5-methylaminomethyl-2-thiouridine)(34)-methyltransferase MnmD [Gammaproteobacteria bacterium]|nr:tRNA (5-methylaminomethyl-2-thiouridine)(34)-methyltransferase MnmD [Gammaproteobacteria bacterium]